MRPQNFTRSNVNERTLSISAPGRSSFDLSHNNSLSLGIGRLLPVNVEYLMPGDTVQGSLSPHFELNKVATPNIGRTRLDTHTFFVPYRRFNRDFKLFIENTDGSAYSRLPSFSYASLWPRFINVIFSGSFNATSQFPGASLTWAQCNAAYNSATTLQQFCEAMRARSMSFWQAYRDYTATKLGYTRDFAAIEYERIKSLVVTSATKPEDVFLYVIKPFLGDGSLADMLGYPIVTRYSQQYNWFSSRTLADWKSMRVGQLILMSGTDSYLLDLGPYSYAPYLANYCVYFDYFRDHHVEARKDVMDPDTFGGDFSLTTATALERDLIPQILQITLPHARYFARDILTTVQTDDIYRHVYTPILDESQSVNVSPSGERADFNNLLSVTLNASLAMWPYGRFSVDSDTDSVDVYKSDLQTMRRAGMLERWLARNYFNPDTYTGQIEAHYNVTPSDVNILMCEYLGGSEKMISGSQTIANTDGGIVDDLPTSPRGTRTFVGGVEMSDSFSFHTTEHGLILSYASIVPLVKYDAANMHLHELTLNDMPFPEFAQDARVEIRTRDILRGFDNDNNVTLGYVPRYYQYRLHADEVHGDYLTDKRSYDWFRDNYNMKTLGLSQLQGGNFTLSPYSLRVHLDPDMFIDGKEWLPICYGNVDIQMYIDRPLPGAIEFI